MIKDKVFKALCIPLLGIFIPLASGLIEYSNLKWAEIIVSNLLFILVSYAVWHGAVYIVSHARRLKWVRQHIFFKLLVLCFTTAVFSFLMVGMFCFIWQRVFTVKNELQPVLSSSAIAATIVIFLTLIYEVLFLSKERELDVRIVDQLDKERMDAEMSILKNELDPHFILNSLTTLSHLIGNDVEKAQQFTQKLAQVYKYLLINKDREVISLDEELKFTDDYSFLLRIRYDNKISLQFSVGECKDKTLIPPCSLQLLIENAIKHNQFTEEEPLLISIALDNEYLVVENNVREKQYATTSTKIGLNNLSSRYKLIGNKNIIISQSDSQFMVKLPLIKQHSL